jgi:hypothetical protein
VKLPEKSTRRSLFVAGKSEGMEQKEQADEKKGVKPTRFCIPTPLLYLIVIQKPILSLPYHHPSSIIHHHAGCP